MSLENPENVWTEEDLKQSLVEGLSGEIEVQIDQGPQVKVSLNKEAVAQTIIDVIKDKLADEEDVLSLATIELEFADRATYDDATGQVMLSAHIHFRIEGEPEGEKVSHIFRMQVNFEESQQDQPTAFEFEN